MTTIAPAAKETAEGPLARLRWALADGWAVARRDLLHWAAQPMTVVFGIVFPIVITLAFGYLFGGAVEVPRRPSWSAAPSPTCSTRP